MKTHLWKSWNRNYFALDSFLLEGEMSLSTSIRAWMCRHFLMEQSSPQKLIWAIACPVRQWPFSTSFFTVYNPSSDTAGGGVSGTVAHARSFQWSLKGQLKEISSETTAPSSYEMQGKKTSQETATMFSELQTKPKGPQTAPKSPVGLLRKRGQEAIPKMQPAMMMFSSKYWARRGLSLDSAMYDQQHLAASMVSTEQFWWTLFWAPHPI